MADSLKIENLPAVTVHSVALTAAWAKCVGAWDDEQIHQRALQLAVLQQGCAWLAGRYAAVAKQRPDDAVAVRQLAKLAQAAETALADSMRVRSTRSPLATKKVSPVVGAVVILLFLLISGVVLTRVLQAPTIAPAAPLGIPRTGH